MWEYRDGLIQTINENVNFCQSKFGGRTVLATESEPSVKKVISAIEFILQNGLKPKSDKVNLKNINLNVSHFSIRQMTELVSSGINMVIGPVTHDSQSQPVFWHFVRHHLTRHEQDRFHHLQTITTDYGRGRSWLRSSINEHSLDRYLRMLFSDPSLLSSFYDPSALINETAIRECLLQSSKDLRSVIFALVLDRKELNHCDEFKPFQLEPEAVVRPKPASEQSQSHSQQTKVKSKVRVVDLDCSAESTDCKSIAINIPQSADEMPSLKLYDAGSGCSVKSIDSQESTGRCHSSLNLSEMKQMLIDITDKKNRMEEEKCCLEVKVNAIVLEKQQSEDKLRTLEEHNVELNKENLILREQLKQYMGVVQMLKSSDKKESTPPPDHHQEDNYFEDKLVQVAEMHGELMEFNSHLQNRLQAADYLLNRFRNELVHLRGSFSSDYVRDEDRSNINNATINHPLIHVWIPSTFLVHEKVKSHHVYQVIIRHSKSWII